MTVSEVRREKLPYLDPARTVEERVDDLLGRLTLEEKVAQLGSRWVWELADDEGRLRPEANALLRDGLGQVTRVAGASGLGPEQVAELANMLQRTLVEETRLGIPAKIFRGNGARIRSFTAACARGREAPLAHLRLWLCLDEVKSGRKSHISHCSTL